MSELEIYETEPLTIGEQEVIDDNEQEDDTDRSDEYRERHEEAIMILKNRAELGTYFLSGDKIDIKRLLTDYHNLTELGTYFLSGDKIDIKRLLTDYHNLTDEKEKISV